MELFLKADEPRKPAGYLLLRERHAISCLPHHVESLMPNRPANLFVRLCLQNQGSLSKAKRQLPEYAALTGKEIAGLEAAVAEAFALDRQSQTRLAWRPSGCLNRRKNLLVEGASE
jgi:hypothetical protein